MAGKKITLVRSLLILTLATNIAVAATFELPSDNHAEECKNLREMIEYYNNLRTKGGTPILMQGWDRFLSKYEVKYETRQCPRADASQQS